MNTRFEEIKDLFYENAISVDKTEMFWFQKAWEILNKNKLTQFNSEIEELKVHMRALVLVNLYGMFSN